MSKYNVKIFQRDDSNHPGITVTDSNGDVLEGIKYNNHTMTLSYAIYDAIIHTIGELQETLNKADKEISILKDANNTLKTNIASTKKDNERLTTNNNSYFDLVQRMSAVEAQNAFLNTVIETQCKTIENMSRYERDDVKPQNDYDMLKRDYDSLKNEYEEVCGELVDIQDKNNELIAKIKELKAEHSLGNHVDEIFGLKKQLDATREENKHLHADIAELRKENIRLTSELNNEQCKRIVEELKTLTNDTFSTEIPEELENNDIISKTSKSDGKVYDVRRFNATTGQLDHVARIHVHEKDRYRFRDFHKITEMFKPCTISELRLWQSLSDNYRFSMRFEIDGDTSESKLKGRYGDRGVISQIAPDIVPKRPAAVETGDGYHIASLLAHTLGHMFSSMDEETLKKFFTFDDDSEDPNKKG